MVERKRPENEDWDKFVEQWYARDHAGKVLLSWEHGVMYDTARHWLSDTGSTRPRAEPEPVIRPIQYPRDTSPLFVHTPRGLTTAAIIGDTHNPYQDTRAVQAVEKFLAELQPDYLFYNGDLSDFYQVSVFAKDPARLGELQSDIDMTTDMFARHVVSMPNTKKILVEGTHENRWYKYLQERAPAVSKLRGTNIIELYKLESFGIDYAPFERGVLINGTFLVLHGDIASIHSSYTAKRHYEKHGGNGICNHTHRGGSYYKRDRFGTWGWWENFCLCRLDPDWIQNPNWQQGFSLVHFQDDGRFWVEQIPIVHGKFIYGGKLYGEQQ